MSGGDPAGDRFRRTVRVTSWMLLTVSLVVLLVVAIGATGWAWMGREAGTALALLAIFGAIHAGAGPDRFTAAEASQWLADTDAAEASRVRNVGKTAASAKEEEESLRQMFGDGRAVA